MQLILEYIQLPQEQRQLHLKLDESCDERGGNSTQFKGLLAHFLGTEIPMTKWVNLCHACHNGKCSNVRHLYWGTPAENSKDALNSGGKTFYEKLVEKHGIENVKEMQRENGRKYGKLGGGKSKGKIRSDEHRRLLAEANKGKRWYTDGINNYYIFPDFAPKGTQPGMTTKRGRGQGK